MAKRSRYRTLSLAEKAAAIRAVEGGRTKFEVTKEFGVAASALSPFLKNEESFLRNMKSGNKDKSEY